jgi:hypothetical protein
MVTSRHCNVKGSRPNTEVTTFLVYVQQATKKPTPTSEYKQGRGTHSPVGLNG